MTNDECEEISGNLRETVGLLFCWIRHKSFAISDFRFRTASGSSIGFGGIVL